MQMGIMRSWWGCRGLQISAAFAWLSLVIDFQKVSKRKIVLLHTPVLKMKKPANLTFCGSEMMIPLKDGLVAKLSKYQKAEFEAAIRS